jgi:uncharacterized membrane protein
MEKRRIVGVSPLDAGHHNTEPPVLGGIQVQSQVRVSRSPEACYRYWRDFGNFPNFMNHVSSVKVLDNRRSHWVVSAPADTTAEWDAEIIEDLPNERISWRSLKNAQVDNAGSVHFASRADGRETDVKVALSYNPPLGVIGEALLKLFGESPDQELSDDLSRFKEAVEKEK